MATSQREGRPRSCSHLEGNGNPEQLAGEGDAPQGAAENQFLQF